MNHDDLIHHYLDGTATQAEADELSQLIETDADMRTRYLALAELHAALSADETLRPVLTKPAALRLWSWIPALRQMAAGVVLGGVAVSAVWAYALPKSRPSVALPLVDASFESGIHRGASVPDEIGRWSGDPVSFVSDHAAVKPRSGSKMLKFLAADNLGGTNPKNMSSDVWQVMDLPGDGPRDVIISAWFNAETTQPARFHLMAMASDADATSAPSVWKARYLEANSVPAAARSMTFVDANPTTWEQGEVVLRVPASAKTLIIGIGAYRLSAVPGEAAFSGQFVDEVRVTLSSEEVLP